MKPDDPIEPTTEPKTDDPALEYGIDELADLGGVTRRTVRYYVTRGLLPAPLGLGRGRHYTAEHLARLIEIRERQEAGESLSELEARFHKKAPELPGEPPPRLSPWTRLTVADGIELHLRDVRLDGERARALQQAILQALDLEGSGRRGGRT